MLNKNQKNNINDMFLDVYYGLGILITLLLLNLLIKWNKVQKLMEWHEKFQKVTKEKPKQSDFRKEGDYNLYIRTNLIIPMELIWMLIGMFTQNWFIFLAILIYAIILKMAFNKIKWSLLGKIISYKYLILRIVIYSSIILEHFNYFLNSSLSSFY